jgi:FKBP-type peptidyl-prolyl cis-trans isomerase FkpA
MRLAGTKNEERRTKNATENDECRTAEATYDAASQFYVLRSSFRSSFFVLGSSFCCVALLLAGCGSSDSPTAPTDPSVGLNVPFSTTDLVVGSGTEATTGRSVTVQYTGWLYYPNAAENKGKVIDPGGTFGPFVLGNANIIQGWHQGIPGMRVGGRRRLVIPPSLAYGAAGRGEVPGNSTLLFEITMVSVQ